jgi:homoserine O-acetyltransferase/O-succinyltransferase
MPLLEIATLPGYELTGPPDAATVLVLGGISATRHVASSAHDASPGWWEPIVGPGRAVDSSRWRVLGVDHLDGGETSDGRAERTVTTAEQADAIAALLDALGIETLHALIGASYGGMVALAFAERHPARLERLVVIGAAHEPHPATTALRAVQRGIIELGLETGRATEAVVLARALAMTTYRTRRELGERFAGVPRTCDGARPDTSFPVERYLLRNGERFAATCSAARYLALSLSADLHTVTPERIRTPTLLVAAEDDGIVPREQVDELARRIAAPVKVAQLSGRTGHDAFLTETSQVSSLLLTALDAPEFP